MEEVHERGRQNQLEFRYANERLMDLLTGPTPDGQLVPFLCECANMDCLGRIEITTGRYSDIHSGDRDYVILPGHLRIAGETILEENASYEVVKKAA